MIADKHRLLRRVGEGPSGTVYEARNVIVDRRFAVKILHRRLADDVDLVRRFVCDSMTAAAIRHPGIAAVYEAGVANDGAPFLVGEFLDGDNLAACAGGGRQLAAAWVADVAVQVLGALAAAHAAGIVHGNIKPSNVHLLHRTDSPTVVKLVDFGSPGAVRSAGAAPTGPDAPDLAGINCTAPERLLGGREADRRADLYAVGVVMYECLTGRRPFEGSDEREVTARILAGRFPRPIELNPAVPIGLDLLVLRMMAGDPGERPATADEAIAALARFIAPEARAEMGLADVEPPPSPAVVDRVESEPGDAPAEPHETPVPVPSPRPSPLWRRSAPLAAAAMAGALAGAAVFLAVSRDQVPDGRTAAERPAPQPVVENDSGVVVIEVRLPGHEPLRTAVVPGRDRHVEVVPVPLAEVAGDDVLPAEAP
ncbi:MAG: serine/threonine-protein kinase, partial [Myxococcota bacterium]|nr:serine/threonine-protein kinase [Myxococcota bacterium]